MFWGNLGAVERGKSDQIEQSPLVKPPPKKKVLFIFYVKLDDYFFNFATP